jgi:NADH:ubiquinone oxidoreductase subunit F (NADH-binding)
MLETLDRVAAGAADGAEGALLHELGEVVQLASLCGLGQAAPLALRAAFEHFPEALPRVVS